MDSNSGFHGIDPGRITSDAVQRRFRENKKTNKEEEGKDECYFYCGQCSKKISGYPSSTELKAHFDGVQHKPKSNCWYCSKPVYEYKFQNKMETYHKCED